MVLALILILPILCLLPKALIHLRTTSRVHSSTSDVPTCRVALVLGAKIYPGGGLSEVLRDRVDKAIDLYKAGKVKKLLMSGDNRVSHYNEPQRMAEYAIENGVDPKDVAMDFAGRRTYDSVFRAKHIFGLNEFVVVTQRCHAERAVFICDAMGVKACGAASDVEDHSNDPGDVKMAIREFPACCCVLLDLYVRHPYVVQGSREVI